MITSPSYNFEYLSMTYNLFILPLFLFVLKLPIINIKSFFYNPKNLTFPFMATKMDKNHIISSTPITCHLTIDNYLGRFYLDKSMKNVNGFTNFKNVTDGLYYDILNYNTHFYVFCNIFVESDTSFAYDNTYYKCFHPWGGGEFHPGPLIAYVDEIIVTGTKYAQGGYGHFLNDQCHSLLLMPEEIQKRCKILVYKNYLFSHVKDCLLALGIKSEQLFSLPRKTWLFASFVYSVLDNAPASYIYGNMTFYLHGLLENALNLKDIKPTKYYYCNRQYMARRYIHNMKEIIDEASKKFPNIVFENLTDIIPSFKETAITWSAAKFVFLPCGANTFKCIFMKPNSVLVMPTTLHGDWAPIKFAVSNFLFILQYATPLIHYQTPGCPIDVNHSLLNIERGIYCTIHSKWPQ